MRNVDNPPFSDREYWDKSVDAYISGGYARNNNERQLWEYFKYCLQTGNRYYFEHPLLPRIKELLGKNVITIPSEMVMYRARVDRDNELLKINNAHQAVFFMKKNFAILCLKVLLVDMMMSTTIIYGKFKINHGF